LHLHIIILNFCWLSIVQLINAAFKFYIHGWQLTTNASSFQVSNVKDIIHHFWHAYDVCNGFWVEPHL